MGEAALLQFPYEPVEMPEAGRVYEHSSGDLYRVLVIARNSDQPEEYRVIYKSLARGHVWDRSLKDWMEIVRWPNGELKRQFSPAPITLPNTKRRAAHNDQRSL